MTTPTKDPEKMGSVSASPSGALYGADTEGEPSGPEYTPDQQRVAFWLVALTGIGGGKDPVGFLMASHAAVRAQRDEAQSAVTAWQQTTQSLEAHIMDRAAMKDPANPETYLRILRAEVAQIERVSQQIVAARWADYRRQQQTIDRLEAELEALKGDE